MLKDAFGDNNKEKNLLKLIENKLQITCCGFISRKTLSVCHPGQT
ncbi:hypothetical protein FEM08_04850 [Flavobacterium gilvum]|nr:hypothetical protein FEM08_04850 [Flavobacterium gilvum]